MRQVAEGVATAFSLVQLIEKTNRAYRRELSYPIIFGVKEILEGKRTPAEGLRWVRAGVGRRLGLATEEYGHGADVLAPSLSHARTRCP